MNLLPIERNNAVRLAFALLLAVATGLLGQRGAVADEPHAGLRLTEAPALLPVGADEPRGATTLRLLAAEAASEPRATQSQLRLLPAGAASSPATAKNRPSHTTSNSTPPSSTPPGKALLIETPAGNPLPSSLAIITVPGAGGPPLSGPATALAVKGGSAVRQTGGVQTLAGSVILNAPIGPSSLNSGLPSDEPPEGPWCFAEDSSTPDATAGGEPLTRSSSGVLAEGRWMTEKDDLRPRDDHPASGVIQASHPEQPGSRSEVKQLLGLLEEEPPKLAQTAPEIPRVLPPPHAMLPPDSALDDTQTPMGPSPFQEEPEEMTPQLPPRRLPTEIAPGGQPARRVPAVPSAPPVLPQQDTRYETEYDVLDDPRFYGGHVPQRVAGSRDGGRRSDAGDHEGRANLVMPWQEEPVRLLHPCCLECRDMTLGGWLDQGISGLGNNPVDRYNGPVVFNDRCAEFQMNQLYLFLEREICTCGGGFDLGGRVDLLYGTDARFVGAIDGLEESWDQQDRFYQMALPQFYLDLGLDDWSVRMGHYYAIMGYEEIAAPANFFYSHSYAYFYSEPTTSTGMLVTYDGLGELSLTAGFSRGIDQFNDTDGADHLCFLGGIAWTRPDKRRTIRFDVNSGEQGPGNSTMIYSVVGELQVTDRLQWVLAHNYGQSTGNNPRDIRKAQWYGLAQYLFYQWTEHCGLGARIEWFSDIDGTVVRGHGEGNMATGPYIGDFYEVTLGANWQPKPNVLVRPEVRWDWYHGQSPEGHRPFDAGQSDRQLLYGFDVIVQF